MKKDVYDHLNDIEMDVSQFEAEEVSETEKAKMKRDLKRKIRRPKPVRWRKIAAAASISIGLSSAALFGLSFTSFAQEIPIIGQVFKWFNDDGFFENYSEQAKELAMTQEDNGISMTVNEAIFDGKTLYVTYELTSEKDLGESPWLDGMPDLLDNTDIWTLSTRHDIKKIDSTHYAGITTAQIYPVDRLDEGNFEFTINEVLPDESMDGQSVPVNLTFQFDLRATENKEQLVNNKVEQNDVTVTVKKVMYTPMSFMIYYDENLTTELMELWDFITVDIVVKDDIGNEYANRHNGGSSNSSTLLNHTNTFERLDPKATKLIITPVVQLLERDGTTEYGAIYRNQDSTAPMEEFEMDEIVIEIEK